MPQNIVEIMPFGSGQPNDYANFAYRILNAGAVVPEAKWVARDTGNDSTGDGTYFKPWRTIQHALDQIGANDHMQILVTENESATSENITLTDATSYKSAHIMNLGPVSTWYSGIGTLTIGDNWALLIGNMWVDQFQETVGNTWAEIYLQNCWVGTGGVGTSNVDYIVIGSIMNETIWNAMVSAAQTYCQGFAFDAFGTGDVFTNGKVKGLDPTAAQHFVTKTFFESNPAGAHALGGANHSADTIANFNSKISDLIPTYGAIRDIGVGTLLQRPAPGTAGRFWWATDLKVLYYDDGLAWTINPKVEDLASDPLLSNDNYYRPDGSGGVEAVGFAANVRDVTHGQPFGGDELQSSATSYQKHLSIIFQGKTQVGSPTKIYVNAWNVGGTSFDVRIRDITNGTTICEKTGQTNSAEAIIDMGTLSNLPTGQARWELQFAKTGTGFARSSGGLIEW